jgi:hypothetical protein
MVMLLFFVKGSAVLQTQPLAKETKKNTRGRGDKTESKPELDEGMFALKGNSNGVKPQ